MIERSVAIARDVRSKRDRMIISVDKSEYTMSLMAKTIELQSAVLIHTINTDNLANLLASPRSFSEA
jgi:hypothetical protein